MSFTLESRGENYVKLSMRWCRGWVRIGRDASLSSRYNSRKAQPFGIHFDFGYCRPIPRNVNLKKERPVCIFFTLEGHVKHVIRRGRGWVRTTRVASLSSRYTIAAKLKRWVRVRKRKKSYKRREKRLRKSVE
jgi:hypothetical protein